MLKIGMQETISNLNPLLPLTVIENDALDQIYETLFILQPDGVYHPALVNKFSVSQDGRQYSLTLQANGTFHDGEPLTAKDVAFSLDFYKKLWGLSFLEKVEAPDDTTILLSLAEPVPDIGYKLGQLYILPEHIWGPMAGDPNQLKAFKNEKPVGSGLFKVTDFQPGKSLRFIANKTYWKDQPKVDEMLWKTYNQQDDMVQALIKGEIDAIANLPITTTNALKSLPNIRVISGPPVKPVFNDIIFNLIDPEKCPKKGQDQCTGNPALQDVRVRQALAHATDKKTIIEITTSNTAKAGLTIVTDRQEPWFNTNLQDYTYDLNQANQILDEAGYKDGNKDGIREIPRTNSPLVLRLYYPGGYPKYTYERLAELLKKDWNTIGIQVTEKSLDENTLHDIINPNFNFDMILWGYGGLQPDPNNMLSILTTRAIASGRSDTGYANPEYDTLFDQQRIEMNPEKRKEIIWKMQEIMLKDVPYIIPYYERTAYAVSTEHFSGWTFNQEKIMPLYAENLAKIALIR
jgi:peptide/nickel transport system substrate-binding protein